MAQTLVHKTHDGANIGFNLILLFHIDTGAELQGTRIPLQLINVWPNHLGFGCCTIQVDKLEYTQKRARNRSVDFVVRIKRRQPKCTESMAAFSAKTAVEAIAWRRQAYLRA